MNHDRQKISGLGPLYQPHGYYNAFLVPQNPCADTIMRFLAQILTKLWTIEIFDTPVSEKR